MAEYSHILTLGSSSNRQQTLSTLGIIVREVLPDGAKRRVVLRHSEGHWHARGATKEGFAIVRALEVALEHGYVRLLFQSRHHRPRRHRDGSRHRLYDEWEPALRARMSELVAKFAFLHFGASPRTEQAARALARRARNNPPPRPRSDPDLNLDAWEDDWTHIPPENERIEEEGDHFDLDRFDPTEIPF